MKLRDLERHLIAHGAEKVAEGGKHTKCGAPMNFAGLLCRAMPKLDRGLYVQSASNSGSLRRSGG